MTATDVLCRLLDERGVEYVVDEEYGKKYPPEKRVTWSCDLAGEDMTVTARDYCISINDDDSADYYLDLDFHEVFTPEQAIAATLGTGTCHDLAETPPYRDKTEFKCSECGYEYSAVGGFGCDSGDEPDFDYCPNCGRRVEQ